MSEALDLEELSFDQGGHLLLVRALAALAPGERVEVRGRASALPIHVRGWCRARGHGFREDDGRLWVTRGTASGARWVGALDTGAPTEVQAHADPRWGLAARGAYVEASSPPSGHRILEQDAVWSDDAGRMYRQAAAAQWDPETTIDWSAPLEHPEEVEDAVVQVMTYLIENETAALIVPAKFTAQIHPHFREVLQVLAVQAADEARHIEVFTRRALLRRERLALSTAGGQASLKTLLDEPDFALASFLLSVLGEGSFLCLLHFLERHGPDPITRQVALWSARDEARHVAFGLAHLKRHAEREPRLRERLAAAIERRHDALANTAGLNEEVFDALIVLAAGSWEPSAIRAGYLRVQELVQEMDRTRKAHLRRLGFGEEEAATLSALHTRNFM